MFRVLCVEASGPWSLLGSRASASGGAVVHWWATVAAAARRRPGRSYLPGQSTPQSVTLELMELENIVANTVYLKAREGNWRRPDPKHYLGIYSWLLSRFVSEVSGGRIFRRWFASWSVSIASIDQQLIWYSHAHKRLFSAWLDQWLRCTQEFDSIDTSFIWFVAFTSDTVVNMMVYWHSLCHLIGLFATESYIW